MSGNPSKDLRLCQCQEHECHADSVPPGLACRKQPAGALTSKTVSQIVRGAFSGQGYGPYADMPALLMACAEESERLRAALERYGRHEHPNCYDLTLKEDGSFGPRNGCLCGFDAANGEGSPVETTGDDFDIGDIVTVLNMYPDRGKPSEGWRVTGITHRPPLYNLEHTAGGGHCTTSAANMRKQSPVEPMAPHPYATHGACHVCGGQPSDAIHAESGVLHAGCNYFGPSGGVCTKCGWVDTDK